MGTLSVAMVQVAFLHRVMVAAATQTQQHSRLPTGPRNLTVYRVSPLAYPGLVNMDTGDAAGDIGFGLWELLMPMECRGGSNHGPGIGCTNGTGKYIHPGDPTNVYEKFVVDTNPLLGTYHNCNPLLSGPGAGEFNCDSMDFGEGHCLCSGPNEVRTTYDLYHEDCMNGTVFRKLAANQSACEAACTDAPQCAAFAVPEGPGGGVCHLLKEPLIQWNGGATVSPCRCGIRNQGSLDAPSTDCACYKFNHLAVGFQNQAGQAGSIPGMPCNQYSTRPQCDSADSCRWVAAGGSGHGGTGPAGFCNLFSCANHTTEKTCTHAGDDDCMWNTTSSAAAHCGTVDCRNFTKAAECGSASGHGCGWVGADAGCAQVSGWNHHSPTHLWRDR
jgi:hypothetical protein